MANQKSKYVKIVYGRVQEVAREWVDKQIPGRFASVSAYMDYLIMRDRRAAQKLGSKKGL